ncbi:MAG TPA: SAM-dependent chlorinase/fluorinase [Kofleriaceae bacterium]|nr:SAM-dependent chlorinase/fluorinase [Kofleriaceae bacterium]
MAIITLTTDFGTADGYVGAMKGVILRLAGSHPAPLIVDLAHDVAPGDIAHAAWVVATSTPEFPHGSIHVVVVDPGVGGARREVIVRARNRWYVGPDNGVFGYVAERTSEAYAIESDRFRAERVSRTFHGRDVFARTAAAIASGEDPAAAGPRIELAGQLPWGARDPATGRVVHIDRFGNLITDLPEAEAGPAVTIADQVLPLAGTYEDVAPGALVAYIGSAGTVEIAVRDGRADRRLGVARGAAVVVAPGDGSGRRGPYR